MGGVWQGNEAIPVAFGVADVDAPAFRINIPDLQAQPFSQAQAHAVEDEEEHPVAEDAGGLDDALHLADADNVGQALYFGRFDKPRRHPRFAQHMLGVELETVQVELDGTPGVRGE